jgi:hypothetical protein
MASGIACIVEHDAASLIIPVTDVDDPRLTSMPMTSCPHCGQANNAASRVEDVVAPKFGDLCVCIACAQVSEYDAALRQRKMSEAELAAICAMQPGLAATMRKYQRSALRHRRGKIDN